MNGAHFLYVAIDGSNLINRIIEDGVPKERIARELSISGLSAHIQTLIRINIGTNRTLGTEFFHSNNLIGPKGKQFTKEEQDQLLRQIADEPGVTTRLVDIPGNKEKGIDIAVASALFEKSGHCETLVLVSSDRDYIPVLESLKRMGKYVVTVGFRKSHPSELINLSFLFIDLCTFSKGQYLKPEMAGIF